MSARKRGRFTLKPAGKPNSEINVTPLVDVVLVLLIIFMVVTPLLEKDIDVRIPETEKVETPQEVPEDQLVVSLTADGALKLNSETLDPAGYVEKLERVLAAKPSGKKVVFFSAEDAVAYPRLVAALDGAKKAGAETLGMMTQNEATAAAAPAAPATP